MFVQSNIAWKNLAGERTRFAISVAGVAFSVVLVLTLRGLYRGVIDEATRYVRSAGADLWVAQAGIPPRLHPGDLPAGPRCAG